jgi:polyphosphate kinase 2 (PPK2 family)
VILKFFLNVSQKEQHSRFLTRIDDPVAQWKFSAQDFKESSHFDEYMDAYQAALRATSKPWAPWYCVPADSKSYMRRIVAETIVDTLSQLALEFPEPTAEMRQEMANVREQLKSEAEAGD